MTVDESSPLRAVRDGQTYYFCNEHCRKKFVEQARARGALRARTGRPDLPHRSADRPMR